VKVYLLDPDDEGTVIILVVVHVTSHTTTYIYIKGFGQETAEKM
jgi:hypothetical protein